MGVRRWLTFLRDWWGVITAAVVGGWLVISGLPMIYHAIYHQQVSGFYFMVAVPVYLMSLVFLPVIGIAWHIYKESTDPLMLAVRERVAREFMEGKQWEGLMEKLTKAEMQRVLDYYFPPIRGSTTERVKARVKTATYRVVKYVREHVQ